jgi:hypothetical protein
LSVIARRNLAWAVSMRGSAPNKALQNFSAPRPSHLQNPSA